MIKYLIITLYAYLMSNINTESNDDKIIKYLYGNYIINDNHIINDNYSNHFNKIKEKDYLTINNTYINKDDYNLIKIIY